MISYPKGKTETENVSEQSAEEHFLIGERTNRTLQKQKNKIMRNFVNAFLANFVKLIKSRMTRQALHVVRPEDTKNIYPENRKNNNNTWEISP
jgi:hypothetical protein